MTWTRRFRSPGARWVVLLAVLVLAGLMLAACGGGTEPNDVAESGTPGDQEEPAPAAPAAFTLRVGLNAFPPQMDPHRSTAAVDRQVYQSLYDKLVDLDADLNIVPELAERWEISDEGTVYTFHLRQGVSFHDGTPFNAEAVRYNFLNRMLDDDFGSPRRSEVTVLTGIEVVDEYTVRITLSEAFSPFLSILADRAGMMVSPTAAEDLGEDFSQNPVGAGPYRFERMVQGDQIVLVRNEDYWREGLPLAERVIFKAVTDENVKVAQLLADELDIIDTIPAPQMDALQSNPDVTLSVVSGLGWQGMWINVTQPPFDNKLLRQAVAAAVDRQSLVRVVFGETAAPGITPFPPGYPVHDETLGVPARDTDRARELLAEAGHDGGFTFTLKIAPSPTQQRVAEVIQEMLGEVDISVEIEQVEFGTLLDQLDSLNFQASMLGWSGRPDPDQNIYGFFYTDAGLNNSGYSNPDVDALLDRGRAVHEWPDRKAIYSEIMDILLDELPYIFMYHPLDIKAMRNDLGGFVHVPDGMIRTLEMGLNP